MTQQPTQAGLTDAGLPITRRTVLKGAAVAGGAYALGVGLPVATGRVGASAHATETIYLSHSVDSESVTKLFTVDLDSVPGQAILSLETTIGGNFQNVDAIAATPDGAAVMFVDRNTAHLGRYDVGGGFTDMGQISGLPTITVLAAFGLDGLLYVASNTTNKLYTVDYGVSPPVANAIGTISGATVNGADIVFDSSGTLFLHSNANDTLYTVDYATPSGGTVQATVVGTEDGSSLTGLAVRGAGQGDLVGSSRTDDAIIVLDKTDGKRTATYPMIFEGTEYSYTNGDMATGILVDETCGECEADGLLAKYEFACVEEVDGECTAWDFVLEEGDGTKVTYELGNFESTHGEDVEPVSATFGTAYCTVYALVKAGQELVVQELVADDDRVTASFVDPYAISFVAFYCTADAAQDAADAFPSNGKGGGNRGGTEGDGDGEDGQIGTQDAPGRGNRRNREGRGNKRTREGRGEGEENADDNGRSKGHGRRD